MTRRHEASPVVIEKELQTIRSLVADGRLAAGQGLAVKYRWAHAVAYVPGAGPEIHTKGSESRPTESQALDKIRWHARENLRRADRSIETALKALEAAEEALNAVLPRYKPGGMKESQPYPYHRQITDADLKAALEAQLKRLSRGEDGAA